MKTAIISFGSRGDLEPLLPLVQELNQRGHQAYIVANAEIEQLASSHFRSLGINVRELLTTQSGKELMNAESSSVSFKILSTLIQSQLFEAGKSLYRAVQDANLLVVNERYYLLALSIGEKLNIPIIQVCFQPKGNTGEYPYPYFSNWYFRFLSNKKTHLLIEKAIIKNFLPSANRLRREVLNIAPLTLETALEKKSKTPLIQGFSKHVFKPPADWPEYFHCTGYWNLIKKDWQPAPDLTAFLIDQRPKIYIGFGSMIYNSEKALKMLTNISQILNVKFVWSLNWADDKTIAEGLLTPLIYVIKNSNHDRLFPLVDLVIHHGGAGTTASAFQHAKPQLVAWFMLDQSFWANQVAKLGGGLVAGNFHKLKPNKLICKIKQLMSNPKYGEAAKIVAQKLQNENGVVIACDYIINGSHLE